MEFVTTARKEYLLDEMSHFVSSKFGILQTVYFPKSYPIECPKAYSLHNGQVLGSGSDLDITTAMIKSLAEGLERYTLAHSRANGVFLYKKSMEDLQSMGYNCFYPEYDFYEDFVYKNNPYLKKMSPDLKTDWTACYNFSDNNKLIWIPASYIHNCHSNLWSHIFRRTTSNGMACSFYDSAVEDSILELIERDTFMYMWLAKQSGEEIILDEISFEPLKNLLYIIGDSLMRHIKLIYKYTDTQIPCVYVLFRRKKEPAFFISGKADVNIERGCYRALLEFVSIINNGSVYKRSIQKIRNTKNFIINTFSQRTCYYAMPENFNKCAFLFETIGKKRLSDLSAKWNTSNKKNLKDKNIFIKDMTPKEIEKTEVRIIRSYSPDLLDLECQEDLPFNSLFKKKRINLVDKLFNKKTESLNANPHCYP